MKLLLVFVLRDATEGDLVLGWGKARGLGHLGLAFDGSPPEWYGQRDPATLHQWEKDLHQHLGLTQSPANA